MGSRAVGAALRRRPRDARPAGNHPRHRRRARAEGARVAARGVAPERRPRRVRRAAAHPRSHRGGPCRSTRRSRKCGGRRCSPRTRRCRPGTTRFRSASSKRTSPGCWGTLGEYRDRFMQLGAYDNGNGPAVQHDGAGAAHGGRRQRRQPAARRRHPRDVGADVAGRRRRRRGRCGRSPTACTCRRGCRTRWRGCSTSTCRRDWRDRHDDPELWAARARHSRTRRCGRRATALRNYLFAFIRERARQRWRDEQVSAGARRRRRHAARSERADHRLRAALHRLQASRADLPRPGAAAARSSTRRAARCRSCSPARRTRPTRPASTTCSRSTAARIDPAFGGRIAFVDDYDLHVAHFLVQGCDVWLNNPRKPLEASGTSGMKASLNGVPHFSIGDGWWAEGFTGDERLADRRRRAAGDHEAQDAADAARIYDLLETRDRPDVLRPRQRHPAPLAADRPPGDRHRRAALQRAPHGQGLRRPACTPPPCSTNGGTTPVRQR